MQGKVEICGVNTARLKTLTHAEMVTLRRLPKAGGKKSEGIDPITKNYFTPLNLNIIFIPVSGTLTPFLFPVVYNAGTYLTEGERL